MSGWISLHRKIMEHPFYKEKRKFSRYEAWIDLLLLANHQDNKFMHGNQLLEVKRGSFVTSELKLMDRWDWGKEKVRGFLKLLEADGMIVKEANKQTTITICNYDTYSSKSDRDKPSSTNGSSELADREQTDARPTPDREPYTNNKLNNDNNEKKKEIKTSIRKRPVYEEDSIPYRSARYLLKKIREHSPGSKEPNIQQWANDMRLMIEFDKRSPVTIAAVIDWATNNEFWQSNILSAAKLREKFDTLQSQMKRGGAHGHVVSDGGSIQQHSEPEQDWSQFVFRGRA